MPTSAGTFGSTKATPCRSGRSRFWEAQARAVWGHHLEAEEGGRGRTVAGPAGKGHVYYSPIVQMRQLFDLDICIRPCRSFPGNPLNFVRRNRRRASRAARSTTDRFFRQNTEGLYSGVEWTNPPKPVRDALETHPQMKNYAGVEGRDLAVSCRILSRGGLPADHPRRLRLRSKFGYKSVTICEKPNVIRETSGMMEEEAKKIAADYPGIALWSTNIDAQMMWLTKNPEDYGVLVASNMFGDIISDGFAGLVGGLGFAASANIGREVAVFEPTHGSAPKYAALSPSIVNPIAMILAACMMLDHVGESADGRPHPRGDCRSGRRGQGPDLRHAPSGRRPRRVPGGRRQHHGNDRRHPSQALTR